MEILFDNMENVCILSHLRSAKWVYSLSFWPCMKKQNSVYVGAYADLLYNLEIIENSSIFFPFFSATLFSFLMFTENIFLNFKICHSLKTAEWRDEYCSKMNQHRNKTRNCYELIVRKKYLYLFNITYDLLYQFQFLFFLLFLIMAFQLFWSQKKKKKKTQKTNHSDFQRF